METSVNMADATLSTPNPLNRFSMQRVKMVARYYYPMFRKQMLIYPLVGLLVGLLYHFRDMLPILGVFFVLLTMAMSFMLYWAPIVLTGKDRTTEILLPARWSEKAVVIMVYFLIVVPILINGSYFLSNGLCSLVRTGQFMVNDSVVTTSLSDLSISGWMKYPLSYFNSIFPLTIFLFIVCRSVRPKAWQGILFSVLANFAFGIAVGVYVVVQLFAKLPSMDIALSGEEAEAMVMKSIDFNEVTLIMTSLLVIGSVVFIILSVRSIRKVQA